MKKTQKKLTDEDKEFLKIFEVSNEAYESVMIQLKFDHSDLVYRALVMGMLKRQTKSHMIFSVWKNLSDEQASHLKDYTNQMSSIAPFMKVDDILLEFVMLYPDLQEKIFVSLSDFFEKFVIKFNELLEA
jgi:hypothetical protein